MIKEAKKEAERSLKEQKKVTLITSRPKPVAFATALLDCDTAASKARLAGLRIDFFFSSVHFRS